MEKLGFGDISDKIEQKEGEWTNSFSYRPNGKSKNWQRVEFSIPRPFPQFSSKLFFRLLSLHIEFLSERFFHFLVKMTIIDLGYQRWSCDTSNWSQRARNHYKIVLGENLLSREKIHRKIQFLKNFTDDVIAYLSDQKWSVCSNSVMRGLNKSASSNFIMGRLSLKHYLNPK